MKELLRISPHQPMEKVVVKDHLVSKLLASGQYKEVGDEKATFGMSESKKEKPVFSEEDTEKTIKAIIETNDIDIDYDIKRDNKRETLLKLQGLGYDVNWK